MFFFSIAMALDPRYKFVKLGDYLKVIYGEFDAKVETTKSGLKGLYHMYKIYVEDVSSASHQSQ